MNTKPYQFGPQLDAGVLYDLYENDYLFIEEIFRITLENFDGDIKNLETHLQAGNLDGLRSIAHKITPVFGYIGMPGIQQSCKDFEERCAGSKEAKEIIPDYNNLQIQLEDCKKLIESELQKLSDYNKIIK